MNELHAKRASVGKDILLNAVREGALGSFQVDHDVSYLVMRHPRVISSFLNGRRLAVVRRLARVVFIFLEPGGFSDAQVGSLLFVLEARQTGGGAGHATLFSIFYTRFLAVSARMVARVLIVEVLYAIEGLAVHGRAAVNHGLSDSTSTRHVLHIVMVISIAVLVQRSRVSIRFFDRFHVRAGSHHTVTVPLTRRHYSVLRGLPYFGRQALGGAFFLALQRFILADRSLRLGTTSWSVIWGCLPRVARSIYSLERVHRQVHLTDILDAHRRRSVISQVILHRHLKGGVIGIVHQ